MSADLGQGETLRKQVSSARVAQGVRAGTLRFNAQASGFKANYRETETGERYWISGPRRDGLDRLYGKSALVVEIDDDVREESWTEIRKKPEQKSKTHT